MKYLALIAVMLSASLRCQHTFLFAQNALSPVVFNPACTGMQRNIVAIIMHRQQWSNITGAPVSSVFLLHAPVNYHRIGIGIRIVQDEHWAYRSTHANALFSYKINARRGYVSFGLSPGLSQSTLNTGQLNIKIDQDPYLIAQQQNRVNASFEAGMVYFTERTRIGICGQRSYSGNYSLLFHAANSFRMNSKCTMLVSTQTRILRSDYLSEISATINWKEISWLGAGVRTNSDIMILGGVDTKLLAPAMRYNVKLGYAMDINIGSHAISDWASHELLVSAVLPALRKSSVERTAGKHIRIL